MKKHNAVKVVLITMLVFLLLSWILPAAYYSGEYVDQGRVQMGLFDMFNYPITALSYFGYITCFLVLVGGFYGILYKIPAYRTFLDKIVEMCKGKEIIALSVIVVVLALLVSTCGLQIAFALFIPFLVAIILLMGYDKMVAAMTIVGSLAVGLVGTTYAYSTISMLTTSLSLKLDYALGVRFIILLVGIVLVIFNTIMYIKKTSGNVVVEKKAVKKVAVKAEKVAAPKKAATKKTTKTTAKKATTAKTKKTTSTKAKATKSSKTRKNNVKAALKGEDIIVVKHTVANDDLVPATVDTKHKIWPIVTGFILLFIIMVLGFITWGDNGFKVTLFDDITKAVTGFELFGFPIFAKILGTVNSFGNWTIVDMFLPMALTIVILMLIYKVSIDEAFDGFAEGAKKALTPALIVVLIYAILVLVTYHPFQLALSKAILGLSKGFNVATTVIVAILAALFNGDVAYTFQSIVPYYTSVVTNVDNFAIAGVIFQAMYGLTMLVVPTSIILMCTLAYLKVSYLDWLKKIWKLLLELFVILLIVFIILALI